jgi:hypothetical protein
MLAIGTQIRYRITAILAAHWEEFFRSRRSWIRPVVIETVHQLLACRTPALGCHVYQCPECGRYAVVPHWCKPRFCPTCGKHATDRWADAVLNDLLDVPCHHLVLSPPGQLRPIILLNRAVGLSLLARAAAACLNQWAREQDGMRMGIITVLHTFEADLKWHPHGHLLVTEGRGPSAKRFRSTYCFRAHSPHREPVASRPGSETILFVRRRTAVPPDDDCREYADQGAPWG